MKFVLRFIFFILCGVTISHAMASPPSGLEKMDAIIARFPGPAEFLANNAAREEYYLASEAYFGNKMNRQSYDAILKQMESLLKTTPELGARLWETTKTGPRFSVQNQIKTSGREMDSALFRNYLHEFRNSLKNPDIKPDSLEALLKAVKEKEAAFSGANMSAAKLRQAQAVHFAEIRKLPEVRELGRHYAEAILKSERVLDLLGTGDADLTLDTLRELRENPRKFLPPNLELPSAVISEIKGALPSVENALKVEGLFPQIMREVRNGKKIPVGSGGITTYDFVPVNRRFHGIWKGVPLGECVGGNSCHLDWLTPQRWATVAIENSHLQYVEKNGAYSGFVEAVPGRVGDKVYATISIGAPDLRKKVIVSGVDGPQDSTLYQEWLRRADAQRPQEWAGFLITNSRDIDNAGVKTTILNSSSYRFGDEVRQAGESFKLIDPLAVKIAEASPSSFYSDGNMILDATTPEARKGTLRTLLPLSEQEMKDPAVLRRLFQDRTQARKIFLQLAEDNFKIPPTVADELRLALIPGNVFDPKDAQLVEALLKKNLIQFDDAAFNRLLEVGPAENQLSDDAFRLISEKFDEGKRPRLIQYLLKGPSRTINIAITERSLKFDPSLKIDSSVLDRLIMADSSTNPMTDEVYEFIYEKLDGTLKPRLLEYLLKGPPKSINAAFMMMLRDPKIATLKLNASMFDPLMSGKLSDIRIEEKISDLIYSKLDSGRRTKFLELLQGGQWKTRSLAFQLIMKSDQPSATPKEIEFVRSFLQDELEKPSSMGYGLRLNANSPPVAEALREAISNNRTDQLVRLIPSLESPVPADIRELVLGLDPMLSSKVSGTRSFPVIDFLLLNDSKLADPGSQRAMKEFLRLDGPAFSTDEAFPKAKYSERLRLPKKSSEMLEWLIKNPQEFNASRASLIQSASKEDLRRLAAALRPTLTEALDSQGKIRVLRGLGRLPELQSILRADSFSIGSLLTNPNLSNDEFLLIYDHIKGDIGNLFAGSRELDPILRSNLSTYNVPMRKAAVDLLVQTQNLSLSPVELQRLKSYSDFLGTNNYKEFFHMIKYGAPENISQVELILKTVEIKDKYFFTELTDYMRSSDGKFRETAERVTKAMRWQMDRNPAQWAEVARAASGSFYAKENARTIAFINETVSAPAKAPATPVEGRFKDCIRRGLSSLLKRR